MMDTASSFMDRISAQVALYIVWTGCVVYWFFQFLGFGFIVGVLFGIWATVIFELYLAYKLFNYEDYLKTSDDIDRNRQFWQERIKGYQAMIEKDFGEASNQPSVDNIEANDHLLINSSMSFSSDDEYEDKAEGQKVHNKKQLIKQKVIEKSLHDLNDNNSNIMLSSGYAPLSLSRKESLRMINKGTHKNEDKNFEVQFHSRLNKAETFIKYFIDYYDKVVKIESQTSFNWIIDQKIRASITKLSTFNIFK